MNLIFNEYTCACAVQAHSLSLTTTKYRQHCLITGDLCLISPDCFIALMHFMVTMCFFLTCYGNEGTARQTLPPAQVT